MLTHRQILANVHLISRSVRTLSSDDLDYVHENGRTYGNSTYHMPCIYMPDGDYAMQDLLSLQHQLFVHALQGKLTTTRLLPSTRRILDLGTGPGHWAIAMARQYSAEVVGIDMTEWDLDTTEASIGPSNVSWELDDLDVWGREPDVDALVSMLDRYDFFEEPSNRAPLGPDGQRSQGQTSAESLAESSKLVTQPDPGWHFGEPYEFIHMRNMKGVFASWEDVYAEVYKSLTPGGWIEVADFDLGTVPMPSQDDGSFEHPMPTFRKIFAAGMEGSFKSGRPLGLFYMNPSYLEEAGFTDIKTTYVNVPVGRWPKDPKQKSIGELMLVVLMETFESAAYRLLIKWGDKDKRWTLEELEAELVVARQEMKDWCDRAEKGEVEGWCASFRWITGRRSWHA
jgi:SAM-dependent methyltransferase